MKITIETPLPGQEDEIIVRCATLDERLMKLIYALKAQQDKIMGYLEDKIVKLEPGEVFYFESVDNKVFAYTDKGVYEVRRSYNVGHNASVPEGEWKKVSSICKMPDSLCSFMWGDDIMRVLVSMAVAGCGRNLYDVPVGSGCISDGIYCLLYCGFKTGRKNK